MSKLQIIIIGLMCSISVSCTETEKEIQVTENNETNAVVVETVDIPFKGTWSRAFSMGEGMDQEVSYSISDTEIVYAMKGSMPMEYSLVMDSFIAEDNRWIGNKGNDTYVIFVKNITSDSITLFKQKIDTKDAALNMVFPSDTTRSKFTSWNVYHKVK